jgi:hypothetical protein
MKVSGEHYRRFVDAERASCTPHPGGWVGQTATLDAMQNKKKLLPLTEIWTQFIGRLLLLRPIYVEKIGCYCVLKTKLSHVWVTIEGVWITEHL